MTISVINETTRKKKEKKRLSFQNISRVALNIPRYVLLVFKHAEARLPTRQRVESGEKGDEERSRCYVYPDRMRSHVQKPWWKGPPD